MTVEYDDKAETVKQWNNDPCGLIEGLPEGSREFYEGISDNRYRQYAPWMQATIGFDRYRGKRVLEVGFGMGTDLYEFARHGAVVSGIDLTPRHLEIAHKRFELYNLSVDLRLGDAENLPYESNSFDVVYSFGVLHHTPNTQRALTEVWRVLAPGGIAIIGMYHRWSPYYIALKARYFLAGDFRAQAWRDVLSTIEVRRHSDARPLVKVYSRSRLAGMLTDFKDVRLEVHHLPYPDFALHRSILRAPVPRMVVERLEPYLGWYVMAFCTK